MQLFHVSFFSSSSLVAHTSISWSQSRPYGALRKSSRSNVRLTVDFHGAAMQLRIRMSFYVIFFLTRFFRINVHFLKQGYVTWFNNMSLRWPKSSLSISARG